MIEIFLKKNWRTVLLAFVTMFAFFVWPTPYRYWSEKNAENPKYSVYKRINRFTGERQVYWSSLGQWRLDSEKGYAEAKKDADALEKK